MPRLTTTKRLRQRIVEELRQADPQAQTLSLDHIPASLFAHWYMSPRKIKEALDDYVRETAGRLPRLECIQDGPVPVYRWVRTEDAN